MKLTRAAGALALALSAAVAAPAAASACEDRDELVSVDLDAGNDVAVDAELDDVLTVRADVL